MFKPKSGGLDINIFSDLFLFFIKNVKNIKSLNIYEYFCHLLRLILFFNLYCEKLYSIYIER